MTIQYVPGNDGKLYLLDSCALATADALANGVILTKEYKEQFRQSVDNSRRLCSHLESFIHSGADLRIIPEVLCEREEAENVMKQRIASFKRTIHDLVNRDNRFNGTICKDRKLARDTYKTFCTTLRDYAKVIRKGNEVLAQRVINLDEMSPEQKDIYEMVLYEASFEFANEPESFGKRLQTDPKIIATAVASSINREVVVISRDNKLLDVLKDKVRLMRGDDNEPGLKMVSVYKPYQKNATLYHPDFTYRTCSPVEYPWKNAV